jgi:hypothetical protein
MATGNDRTSQTSRGHVHALRRAVIGVAAALALTGVAAIPASAASQDGTSNTIQFTVASAVLDQAHHRVIVTSPTPDGLTVGRHFGTVEVATPQHNFVLNNTMVSGLVGTPMVSAITLNFTAINVAYAAPHAPCMAGVDACLIEEDGTYPPAS